jgi:hypothetical protein
VFQTPGSAFDLFVHFVHRLTQQPKHDRVPLIIFSGLLSQNPNLISSQVTRENGAMIRNEIKRNLKISKITIFDISMFLISPH